MKLTNLDGERPLPDGWQWTTIGGITQPIEKVKPQDEPEKEFTYLDISGINNKRNVIAEPKVYYGVDAPSRARQSVKAGDVLFSTVRTYLKNIAQVPELYDGQVASTGFSILRGKERISNKYLFYFSLTDMFLTPLGELQRGSSYPAVRDSDVREQLIPLAPFPEQERIVAEIEKQFTRLDQAVASLKRLQSNLARYKASVLKAACEGRLVPQDPNDEPAADLLTRILGERRAQWEKQEWQKLIVKAQKKAAQAERKKQGLPARVKDLQPGEWEAIAEADYAHYLPKGDKWQEKYKEPSGVETAVLPDLPEGWVWVSMDGLSDIVSGVAKGRKFKDQETVHLPYLRVANVQQGYLDLSQIKKIEARPDELEKYRLQENDLLLTEGGDWDKLGRSAIWKGQVPDCIHQNHIFRARPWHPDLSTVWLMYVTNSEHGRKYFANSSKQTTNLASINLTQLRACPVPLPSKSEMDRIINEVERRLSVAAATEQAITANLARAERLRQSILGRAFSGQLV